MKGKNALPPALESLKHKKNFALMKWLLELKEGVPFEGKEIYFRTSWEPIGVYDNGTHHGSALQFAERGRGPITGGRYNAIQGKPVAFTNFPLNGEAYLLYEDIPYEVEISTRTEPYTSTHKFPAERGAEVRVEGIKPLKALPKLSRHSTCIINEEAVAESLKRKHPYAFAWYESYGEKHGFSVLDYLMMPQLEQLQKAEFAFAMDRFRFNEKAFCRIVKGKGSSLADMFTIPFAYAKKLKI